MNLQTTKSSFAAIHLQLGLIALAVVLGLFALVEIFVVPSLVESRANSIYSLIRSHEANIAVSKIRSLRDELLETKAIRSDQEFSHFFHDEAATVSGLRAECQALNQSICLGKNQSLFFLANSSLPANENYKAVVALQTDLTAPPIALRLWEGIAAMILAIAFGLLHRAIVKKERYLTSRLDSATAAFRKVQGLLSADGKDEFDAFSRSAADVTAMLEEYKAKFERKTRLEQLGLTVGQISHDLKAPLNEAENFLSALPTLVETAPREQIEEARLSLIARIRAGKEALDQALRTTKQAAIAQELLSLQEITERVVTRAKGNPKLNRLSIRTGSVPPHRIWGDRIRLETALINLLENSAEEKLDAQVDIAVSYAGGRVRLSYRDNGRGIPQDRVESIFDPLVTFKEAGTGLGLSSTREILDQHGAEISAFSSPSGALFEIDFVKSWGVYHA